MKWFWQLQVVKKNGSVYDWKKTFIDNVMTTQSASYVSWNKVFAFSSAYSSPLAFDASFFLVFQ